MTNYREILRLDSLGLNKTQIADACDCSRTTVIAVLRRAEEAGLCYPLPESLSDKELSSKLHPSVQEKPVYKMPDYEYVHKELQKSGVTLKLLWLEYCERCRENGELPYQSTQFNKYYSDYAIKTNATMHLNHKPGEIMQVDWAGDTAAVIDTVTGEIIPAYNIREEQISLAKKMYIGFTEKQVALCKAEVGTGKTLSYLVAAIVAKHHNGMTYGQNLPVTITTSSIELQKALVEREIPNLSKMLLNYYIIEKPLTAVLRKGKEHYFCQYRFEDFLKNIKKYPEKYGSTIELLEQIGKLRGGIDLDRYRISGTIKSRICINGSCAGCLF